MFEKFKDTLTLKYMDIPVALNKLVNHIRSNDSKLNAVHYLDYITQENAYSRLNKNEVVLLTKALEENHFIISVEMAFNVLDKEEATGLANLLDNNHRITSLFLEYEKTTLVGERILSKALERNLSITWLNFEWSELSDSETMERLTKHIANNRAMAEQLHEAAHAGNFDLIKQLVEAGASLNSTGNAHNTALHLASFAQHIEITEYLLNQENQVVLKNGYSQYPNINIVSQSSLPKNAAI